MRRIKQLIFHAIDVLSIATKGGNHMSSPQSNVLDFYYLTISLKDMVRSGWKQWNVQRKRLESVAEHIYSTCMLAIAINSEYLSYPINLEKVILMLAVHELEEIFISDITPFDNISPEEKLRRGHEAIRQVLATLTNGYRYEALIHEFDERQTPEAQFAYMCDKLDADLMSLYYDQDLNCTVENATLHLQQNGDIQNLSNNGEYTMGECFYIVEQESCRLDENFSKILEEARWRFVQMRLR